jgi:hypothetical protein
MANVKWDKVPFKCAMPFGDVYTLDSVDCTWQIVWVGPKAKATSFIVRQLGVTLCDWPTFDLAVAEIEMMVA